MQPSVTTQDRVATPLVSGGYRLVLSLCAPSPARVVSWLPVDPSGLSPGLCPRGPHGPSQRCAQSPKIWPRMPAMRRPGCAVFPSCLRCLSSLSSRQVASGPTEPVVLLALWGQV